MKVRVAAGVELLAPSRPVTTSVGAVVVPCDQAKSFESNGPPIGVATVDGVCVQPVLLPPSAAVWLYVAPDSGSETALRILKLPPPDWAPR